MNVTLAEFSLAASLAQCMAFWASSLEWGCAKPIPSHLWSKALPEEPNILLYLYGVCLGVYVFTWIAFRDADVC